jgi:hypothetical protein
MHWFRSNARFGAGLALLALALQLLLSFGHVHARDLLSAEGAATHAVNVQQNGHVPAPPAKRSNDADDICAICALFELVSSSVVATPPPIALPSPARLIVWRIALDSSAPPPLRRPFGARAPPIA